MISLRRHAQLVCTVTTALLLGGCSGANEGEEDSDATGSALSAARAASEVSFQEQVLELERRYENDAEGGAAGTSTAVSTKAINPLGRRLPASGKLCEHLVKLRGLEHAYFYYGGFASADVVVGAAVGMDLVYDLWNRQSAAFAWKTATGNIGTAGSVAVGGYFGYGFGIKENVIDAWAGRFDSAAVSLAVPLTKFGIEGSAFRSPDSSIIGGSIGATAGLALSWPFPVTATLETGFWVPFDAATKQMAAISWGVRRTLKTASALAEDPRLDSSAHAHSYEYVQYERSSDLALGLLWSAPPVVSAAPALQAVALGVLRESKFSVEQLCP